MFEPIDVPIVNVQETFTQDPHFGETRVDTYHLSHDRVYINVNHIVSIRDSQVSDAWYQVGIEDRCTIELTDGRAIDMDMSAHQLVRNLSSRNALKRVHTL